MIRMSVPTPMYTVPPSRGVGRVRSLGHIGSNLAGGGGSRAEKAGLAIDGIRNRFHRYSELRERNQMGLVVLLLVLALLLGGIGLVAHALWWMLIIAAALVIASAFTGLGRRRTTL
jgi:hypothetical protein